MGEFKDDQFQGHWHSGIWTNSSGSRVSEPNIGMGGSEDSRIGATNPHNMSNMTTVRYGTTTHGKQIGVTYLIKVL